MAVMISASVALTLTGCSEGAAEPGSEQAFAEAREVNLEFKATVATVQKEVFDGEWRDGSAGYPVPAVWKQGMAVVHQVLTRFQIGDRDAHLNPRYARHFLGRSTPVTNEQQVILA